ncbi:PepSY domain-containing protein [Corynebacterium singulare]|uniref:PepSY domain-containing protein n=1 Tax=Corynebacterium singulare TaxID=161899 RepID=A0ABS9PTF2_9CORY|nr:PepSY domain-containing protein [Corynebacterium singulare]MCG7275983.1 PepSY domain-containing protein [Corynebacterium singulare]
MTHRFRFTAAGIALCATAALTACSSDDDAETAPAATTPAPVETVTEAPVTTVVEQNDDDHDDQDDQPAGTTNAGAPAADNAASSGTISSEDALAAAYAHAGVDASAVTEKEVELDDGDDARGPHWEIDFTAHGQEHEFDVDATNGTVTNHEVD